MTPQTPTMPPGKTGAPKTPTDLRPEAQPQGQGVSPWDEFTARPQVNALIERWRGFTARPENRAALLQFSINALQPVMPGQSTLGHIASAVGAGVAARDRYAQGQIATEESAAQTAREEAALDLDRQQLDINRQNAETARMNAGQGQDGFVAWFNQQMEYVVQNALVDPTRELQEIQRMWFNGTAEEKASVEQMFRQQYELLTRGAAAPGTQLKTGGVAGAAPTGESDQDTVAALNAQFPNATAGTRKFDTQGQAWWVSQGNGVWVRG